MKILTYTTLFPNAAVPHHGVFVRNRLRRVVDSGEVQAKVVAPVPWFPIKHPFFGKYGKFACAPKHENMEGLEVYHPRFPVIPKIGMNMAPSLLAHFTQGTVNKIIKRGFDFDLIDAHYFYPDGVAAAKLKRKYKKPLVITARGTDINLIPEYPKPRQMILDTAAEADAIITVCAALKDEIVKLGVDANKVTVLRNGVDLEFFHPPLQRDVLRQTLGIDKPTLLSVGHLINRKGHDLVIKAMRELPRYQLFVIGSGEEELALKQLARDLEVESQVRFLGALSQPQLREYYGAADALVLASSREGWANVLLESMACGTPVVATPVWGTPEVVAEPAAGVLTADRSAGAIASAVRRLEHQYPDRADTRIYAERFSWDETTAGQLKIFSSLIK